MQQKPYASSVNHNNIVQSQIVPPNEGKFNSRLDNLVLLVMLIKENIIDVILKQTKLYLK